MRLIAAIAFSVVALMSARAEEGVAPVINPPVEGSVTTEQGADAWDRIYQVVSHPRCANCHVGSDNRPMWSGPSYGKTRPHGMNINAGESRIGAEYVMCQTCHVTRTTGKGNAPHMAPQVALAWQLAPVEFEWFGKTSAEVCAQMSDPERNGGRDYIALAEHLRDDAGHGGFVAWGWNPGGGREAVPFTLQDHINDVLIWGMAGQPCPVE